MEDQEILQKGSKRFRDIDYAFTQRLFLGTVIAIFLAETISMGIIWVFRPQSYMVSTLLDDIIMLVLIIPILYSFTYRHVVRQIKERKQSQSLFAKVLEILPVGVWIIDQSGKILHGNPANIKIWDGTRLIGGDVHQDSPGWRVATGQPIEPHEWASVRAIRDGETTLDEEVEIVLQDGYRKIISNSAIPIVEDQRLRGAIIVNQDITSRKQAEEKLENQNRELLILSRAEQHARKVAETMSRISQVFIQSLELETVIQAVLDNICNLLPCDSAYLATTESETELSVHAACGFQPGLEPQAFMNEPFDIIENRLLSDVIESRQALLVDDLQETQDWSDPFMPEDIHNWLGIPIIAESKVIGVLAIASRTPKLLTNQHCRDAEVVVAQASMAIQNAWLFEQVRAGHERFKLLARQLVEVQESERNYIARELHDETSQTLTAIKFGLRLLEEDVHEPDRLLSRISDMKLLTEKILEDLHRLAMNLRPASLDHLGLVVTLEQLLKEVARQFSINARFKAVGISETDRLPDYIETSLYRIVQEAVTNAVRHAAPANIDVIIEHKDKKIELMIEDDGVGFNTSEIQKSGHLGLLGMQERAQMMGGTLVVESNGGLGTTVVVEIPYDDSNNHR